MNFSSDFYRLIIDSVKKEDVFPDIFGKLEDKTSLSYIVRLGMAIKNFLGPPQLLFCPDMERGIPLFSFEKLMDFQLLGGLGGMSMEGISVKDALPDKAPFLGGLGLYGIFKGRQGLFASMGVTGYVYACLEGVLGFPEEKIVKPEDIKKVLNKFFRPYAIRGEAGQGKTSPSPIINELISSILFVSKNNEGHEESREKLSFFLDFLHTTEEQISSLIETPDSSFLALKGPSIVSLFESMEKELEGLMKFFESKDRKKIIQFTAKIGNLAEKMIEYKEMAEKSSFSIYHRYCLNCGHDNYAELTLCENCKSLLPRFSEDYEIEDFDEKRDEYERNFPRGLTLDSAILDIMDKGEELYFDVVTGERFFENISAEESKLESFEAIIRSVKFPEDLPEGLSFTFTREILLKILECVKELRDGIELFKKYKALKEKEYFLKGMKKITLAGGFLHRLQDICEVCERKMASSGV